VRGRAYTKNTRPAESRLGAALQSSGSHNKMFSIDFWNVARRLSDAAVNYHSALTSSPFHGVFIGSRVRKREGERHTCWYPRRPQNSNHDSGNIPRAVDLAGEMENDGPGRAWPPCGMRTCPLDGTGRKDSQRIGGRALTVSRCANATGNFAKRVGRTLYFGITFSTRWAPGQFDKQKTNLLRQQSHSMLGLRARRGHRARKVWR